MTKIKFEVGPGEVQTIRNLSFDGKSGTITATKPNMEEIVARAHKSIALSTGMTADLLQTTEYVRRVMPSLIAHDIASVQPMPDVDWEALGKAYGRIVDAHGRDSFIPRRARYLTDTERASMEKATRELDAELKEALKDRPRRPAKARETISGTNPTSTVLDDPTEPS